MATYQYKPGLGNVASYQASGKPYLQSAIVVPASSAEPIEIVFPYITRTLVVRCDGSPTIRVGFSANGVKAIEENAYVTLTDGTSLEVDFKVRSIFLRSTAGASTATVIAGLTGIPNTELLTNWSGSSGVG